MKAATLQAARRAPAFSDAGAASPGPFVDLDGHMALLDGLRAAAIVAVFFFHAFHGVSASGAGRLAVLASRMGWAGVDLFFVLSGFLITGILLGAKSGFAYYRSFYARRALRIFPLYYAVLPLYFVAIPMLSGNGAKVGEGLWAAFYLSNLRQGIDGDFGAFPAVWSLCVEEHFYLFWPFLVHRLSARALAGLCAILLAASPLLRWYCIAATDLPVAFPYVFTFCRIDALAGGALLAVLLRRDGWRERLARWGPIALGASLLALALLAWGAIRFPVPQPSKLRFFWGHPLFVVAGYSVCMAGSMALLVLALRRNPPPGLAALLGNRAAQSIGRHSYAIYLLHGAVLVAASAAIPEDFQRRLLPCTMVSLALFALVWVLAKTSWHAIEQPFLRLKDRFPYR